MQGFDFSFAAKPATVLLNQLLEKWMVWEKCRRWYKWFSIIQLFIAYVMLFCSAALFHAGVVLCGTGVCCHSAGEAAGYTQWFNVDAYGNATYSHTQDNGECCKALGNIAFVAGMGCMAGCLACYGLSWLFLALTFIFLYEEVDETAPHEWWVLKMNKDYPIEMAIYGKMNRNTAKIGTVKLHGPPIQAQHVYTGWLRMSIENREDPEAGPWIYCNRRGKLIFERFDTREEADAFIALQMSQSTEVEGVAMAGPASVQRIYPVAPLPAEAQVDEIPLVAVAEAAPANGEPMLPPV